MARTYAAGLPEDLVRQLALRRKRERPLDDCEDDVGSEEILDDTETLFDAATPEERIDAAYAEIRERMTADLLEQIQLSSPAFFERLVLDLLHRLGYGTDKDDLKRTGGSGDGGIDGVIALDKLGLEKVYVQAKRYADENTVGRPAIQAFFGALAGRRATKGVFITTSKYSREAREFARSASDSIVLLDGHRLAQLMIDNRVGVSPKKRYDIVEIDSDYFEGG